MDPTLRTPTCPGSGALSAFRAGTLPDDVRASVEAHVATCPECGRSVSDAFAATVVAAMASSGSPQQAVAQAGDFVEAPDLAPGERVQRYEIRARLAAGAMGTVYEAYDPDLDRLVALKILKTESSPGDPAEELRQRLLREARAMARLSHPNVVAVYEAGTFGEQLFIAMELVRGTTLRDWLARKRRTVRAILDAYADAGAGLAAAHDAGLVHRDFKPDNVLVGDDGRVRVTDFGLARVHGVPTAPDPVRVDSRPSLDSGGSDKLTLSGVVVGTPAYMSPEQFGGGGTDARSDIFAFSVSLYESLYGVRPFAGTTLIEQMKSTLAGRVGDPPRGATVPAAVRRALLRGLARSPSQRPASMHGMLAELVVEAGRGTRTQAWVAVAALLVVGGAAALFFARTPHGRIASADRQRPVFAVMDFEARPGNVSGSAAGDDAWLGGAVARSVAAEVRAGERAQALSPDDLARREMSPIRGAKITPDAAARMRDELGTRYLVLGSYEVEGAPDARRLVLDAHVVDASTGKTLREARARGPLSAARDLSLTLADDLADALGLRELSGEEHGAVRSALPEGADAMRLYAGGLDRALVSDGLGARALLEQAVVAEPSAPMPHAALARVLGDLGYNELAQREARLALDHAAGLARADRLSNEALAHELGSEWDKAAEIQRALFTFFPDDLEYGLRLTDALDHAGKAAEARQTIEAVRALAVSTSDRVRVEIAYSSSLRFLDEPARVVEVARAAAATGRAMGAHHLCARALHNEALGHIRLNETDLATAVETDAMNEFLAAGDKGRAARSQQMLGELLADRGDAAGARKLMESSLVTMRALGEMHAVTGILGDLFILEKRQEHYDVARAVGDEVTQLSFTQSPQERATILYNQGELLFLVGDLAGAHAKNDETIAIRRGANERRGLAFSLDLGSEIALAEGDEAAASRAIEEASALELKDPRARALVAVGAGLLALELGHPEAAIDRVSAACATHHDGKRLAEEAGCRTVQARLLLAAGKHTDALAALDAAAPLFAGVGDLRAARLLAVDDAYVRGVLSSPVVRAESITRLNDLVTRTHDAGCPGDELDARLARMVLELAAGRTPQDSPSALAGDASARGYRLIARHATQRRR